MKKSGVKSEFNC